MSPQATFTPKPLPVFRRAVIDSWRSTLIWTLALAAVLLLYLPLYPSMNGADMRSLISSLPPELVNALGYEDILSGPGYVQATFFGLLGFVLITAAAVSWGSTAIAGAEESGRLELVLSHGVGRVRYAVESALGILVRLLWFAVATTAVVLALSGPSELGLGAAHVLAAEAAWLGLGYLAGSIAMATGSLTGRRTAALGAGAGVAAAGYVMNALANQNADLDWLRNFSPFSWAYRNDPLADGFDFPGLGLIAGACVLFTALAVWALNRRDVLG
ncbi:ABC transporter permease subunit [Arthrobacter gandavensis]|uniref:ABC transporter permease subunit n=1 Tax=Arthrobacter gandavensis TaxID=169960 RepID=UPI0018900503|nr:ABC transporter permease subunit [Arthrobacter gandavensis]MBF4993724.1 ABC transporter permease subunit [Arthrobacter gandavensis]